MPAKITNLNIDHIIELRNDGMSCVEIARIMGCSSHVITDRLKERGISTARIPPKYDVERIVSLYEAGMPKRHIGKELGIHEMIISKILARNGYPTATTRSEATKTMNSRMTAEERSARVASAHDAVRGTHLSHESLCKRAATKASIGKPGSIMEKRLYDLLTERGLSVYSQAALDKYNIDLLVNDSVAVEISGRSRKAKDIGLMRSRTKAIIDRGYLMLVVWSNTAHWPITGYVADYVIALLDIFRSDPSSHGKYWVIRGDGKVLAESCSYSDDLPFIMSTVYRPSS